MAKKRNYNLEISTMYARRNYRKLPEEEAKIESEKILSKYSERTKITVLKQKEQLGISYTQLHTFLQATERYNRYRKSEYNKTLKDIIKPEWESFVDVQSNAWRNEIFDNKGKLSNIGKDVYNRFVEDRLSDLVPTKDKSFILSDSQLKYVPFEKTLATRMEMGVKGYITAKQELYLENFEKALKKTHENASKYIDKYNELTTRQKILFAQESQGYIRYHYTEKDNEEAYSEFEEAVNTYKEK